VILTLQDFKDLYKKQSITKEHLKEYYDNNNQKQEDIGLYNSVGKLLNYPLSFEQIIILYQLEKILLPLTFLENIPLKNITIDKYSDILDAYSNGDLIETSIYTDQNWYLQNLHAFETCIYPNYLLDKRDDNMIKESDLIFTNDLNKTSLKNINKKNIDEILNLSLIITRIIKLKKDKLLKELDLSPRLIQLFVKINKFEYDSTKMNKKKLTSLI
jgi:hypothetical protein